MYKIFQSEVSDLIANLVKRPESFIIFVTDKTLPKTERL